MVINDRQGRLSVDHRFQPRIIPGLYQAIPLVAPQIVVLLTIELNPDTDEDSQNAERPLNRQHHPVPRLVSTIDRLTIPLI